jgi:hypothetical protein
MKKSENCSLRYKDRFSSSPFDRSQFAYAVLIGCLLLSCVLAEGILRTQLQISLSQAIPVWNAHLGIGQGDVPMWKSIFLGLAGCVLISGGAMAQSCSGASWTTLTNGAVADASQVMNNFGCVLTSPAFSGVVRINSTGNVYADEQFSVLAAGSKNAIGAQGLGSTASAAVLGITLNATSGYAVGFYNTGAAAVTGSITNNTTSTGFNTTSDERLKDDRGIASSVAALEALRIHDFVWKATTKADVGLFAQEAYKVLPDIVTKGGVDPHKQPWQVNYPGLIPRLLVGWQNHEYRIERLEKQSRRQSGLVTGNQTGDRFDAEQLVVQFNTLKAANDNQAAELRDLKTQMSALERKILVRTAQR